MTKTYGERHVAALREVEGIDVLSFPMPNESIGDYIVVASVHYDDEHALVLLLVEHPPYFRVALICLLDGDFIWCHSHMNIVPAVREYEDSGGDH